jgi:hypothetical protein
MRKKKTPKEISAAIARYYDSMTDEEVADDRAWGEFAGAQLAVEQGSDEWQDQTGAAKSKGGKGLRDGGCR